MSLTIIREVQNKFTCSENGLYHGEITGVALKEKKDRFNRNKSCNALNVRITVEDGDDLVDLFYSPFISFYKSSRFARMLDCLKIVIEEGREWDAESLIGLNVRVEVENVESNENIYSNVTEIYLSNDGEVGDDDE